MDTDGSGGGGVIFGFRANEMMGPPNGAGSGSASTGDDGRAEGRADGRALMKLKSDS